MLTESPAPRGASRFSPVAGELPANACRLNVIQHKRPVEYRASAMQHEVFVIVAWRSTSVAVENDEPSKISLSHYPVFDGFAGGADADHAPRQVVRHGTASAHDDTVSDADAWPDPYIARYPDLLSDRDRALAYRKGAIGVVVV